MRGAGLRPVWEVYDKQSCSENFLEAVAVGWEPTLQKPLLKSKILYNKLIDAIHRNTFDKQKIFITPMKILKSIAVNDKPHVLELLKAYMKMSLFSICTKPAPTGRHPFFKSKLKSSCFQKNKLC